MVALSNLSYHDFEGIALDLAERERLVTDLGQNNLMILRNHGTLACGRSVAQAFLNMHLLERACQAQRSEEHTSELQSLMRISYAVFCLTQKKYNTTHIVDRMPAQ